MDCRHGAKQKPKLNQISARFVQKVIKGEAVVPDFAKALCPHPSHDCKHGNAGPDKPGGEEKTHFRIKPGDVAVGVIPDLDGYVGKINNARLLAFLPR